MGILAGRIRRVSSRSSSLPTRSQSQPSQRLPRPYRASSATPPSLPLRLLPPRGRAHATGQPLLPFPSWKIGHQDFTLWLRLYIIMIRTAVEMNRNPGKCQSLLVVLIMKSCASAAARRGRPRRVHVRPRPAPYHEHGRRHRAVRRPPAVHGFVFMIDALMMRRARHLLAIC